MFDMAPLAIGTTARSGPSQWLAEAVATFALLLAILGGVRHAPHAVPWLVGLTITATYWFTASTSFAECHKRASHVSGGAIDEDSPRSRGRLAVIRKFNSFARIKRMLRMRKRGYCPVARSASRINSPSTATMSPARNCASADRRRAELCRRTCLHPRRADNAVRGSRDSGDRARLATKRDRSSSRIDHSRFATL